MIEVDDGTLSYNGYTKVIYKGKEFKSPVDIMLLMSWDYICYLLISGEYKK